MTPVVPPSTVMRISTAAIWIEIVVAVNGGKLHLAEKDNSCDF